MNKKDIDLERKRLEKEDEQKLIDAINEQYRKENDKFRKKMHYLKIKQKEQRDRLIFLKKIRKIVFVSIEILIFVLMIFAIIKQNEDFMNDCTSAGHSENYCERGR